jgi:transcriptional regulator with XRE-family HTH domain
MAKPLIFRFSERLKKIRRDKGVTLEELGFRSGLHKNYLSDVECGRRNISLKAVEKLAKGLEVDPHELFLPIE